MPNKVLLFQEGSCHNLKFDFCYVQVRYFDQLREIAAVAGFSTTDQLCKMKVGDFCLRDVIGQLHVGSVNL